MPNPTGTTCLDCAAVLYTDPASGGLVDGWGERTCSASYRPHVADVPAGPYVAVRAAGSVPVTQNMSGRLRRAAASCRSGLPAGLNTVGPGRVPDLPPHAKPAAQDPCRTAPLESATPASILWSGLARGPSGQVPGALRAGGEKHAPARRQSGPQGGSHA